MRLLIHVDVRDSRFSCVKMRLGVWHAIRRTSQRCLRANQAESLKGLKIAMFSYGWSCRMKTQLRLAIFSMVYFTIFIRHLTAFELTVMTYNIWVGGRASGQSLSQTAEVIRASGADLIGLQEQSGSTAELAEMLGYEYHIQDGDISMLSRFPITGVYSSGIEVQVGFEPDEVAYLFNVHFAPYPYGPYDIRDNPSLNDEAVISVARATRSGPYQAAIAAMQPFLDAGKPLFYLGDFNEPSHLDWTAETAQAGMHFGRTTQWPTSQEILAAGFRDSFRDLRPDPVNDPADTWTPGYPVPNLSPNEVHDRIDIIYHTGISVMPLEAFVIGEDSANTDIVVDPFPSDHRAVAITYDFPLELLEGDVNLDGQVNQADVDVLLENWMSQFDAANLEAYEHGDADRDGRIGLGDFAAVRRGYLATDTSGIPLTFDLPLPVPEPATAFLMVLAGLPLACQRPMRG